MNEYSLVEVKQGTVLEIHKDNQQIVPDGAKRGCHASIVRGYSFPSSLMQRSEKEICFLPVESLGRDKTWRKFDEGSCIYVVNSTKAEVFRPLYVGEERVVRDYLRRIGFLGRSVHSRVLDRVRSRRTSEFWSEVLG